MPMPVIRISTRKDGREVAWFKDVKGRIRTTQGANWTTAEQVRALTEYGIELQLEQCATGIGSDGSPMPALSGGSVATFKNGKFDLRRHFGYVGAKRNFGGQPIRDLRGPGKDGHMLDDIRINFLDDKMATIAITRNKSRIKAQANERRANWWGWTAASVGKMAVRAGEIWPQGVQERLVALGLMGAQQIAGAGRFLRRVA